MEAEEIKNKINNIGNIKVIFEPTIYSENRIEKKDLQDILEKSRISLRGWSFPHIPIQNDAGTKTPYSTSTGIEFYTCWERVIEIFRFYQSGQFLAKFALYEDTIDELNGNDGLNRKTLGKYLDFLSVIYRMTEVVLFIKNLLENTDIEGGKLTVEINKAKDRILESIFSPSIPPLKGDYICQMEKVIVTKEFDREKMLTDPLEIGFELIKDIFFDFNWKNPSAQMIKTHQENFLNRRI